MEATLVSAETIAKASKSAFIASQLVTGNERVKALETVHAALAAGKDHILAANREDVKVCSSGRPLTPRYSCQ